MKKNILLIFTFISFYCNSQTFPIGHMSINFKDASRTGGFSIPGGIQMPGTGRNIGTEVYYPATIAGNNVAVATGTFPVVVFGHGFAMGFDSYDNIYNRLASLGYIVMLPRTEGGTIFPPPNHLEFSRDLKTLAAQGMALNTVNTPTALITFNGKVLQRAAIGGHSMGGGASYLSAASNTTLTCLFNFAAATTNNTPNSILQSTLVTVPTLVISGELDSVADSTVQNSHYAGLASTKKFHVIIKDLTHCDVGNGTDALCTIGQAACSAPSCNSTYFRRYMTYLVPYLDNLLKGNCQAGKQFMDTIQSPSIVRAGRKIVGSLYAPFTVTVSGVSTICSGSTTSLTASGASTYTWTGGITNGTAFTPTITQTYSVVSTNSLGCFITNSITLTVNASPTITVNSGSICAGNSFTLTPFGANTYTIQGGVSIVSPLSNNTYTVKGTSVAGCLSSNTASSVVTIDTTPTVSVNSGAICSGKSFTITPLGANTYTIQGGSTNVSPIGNTTYTVIGKSLAGCLSSNTATSSVTVNISPTISVNSGSICAGKSFTILPNGAITYTIQGGLINVSPSSNSNYTVNGTSAAGCLSANTVTSSVFVNSSPTVSVNSGAICTGKSFTISPSGANTYTIQGGSAIVNPTTLSTYSVIGTGNNGCDNTAIASVTVNGLPVLSAPSITICTGATGVINASGAFTYTWNTGINTMSLSASPTGNTTYTVNGTSAFGCDALPVTANITIVSAPIIVVNNATICAGNSTTLTASGITTFTWSNGTNANSIVVAPLVNTTYTVRGNFTGCSVAGSSNGIVTVNAMPNVIASTNNTLLCVGQSANLTANGATSYTWNTNATSPTIAVSPISNTTYTVTGTDVNGCLNTSIVTQSVSTCTSIFNLSEINKGGINVYPNPSNGNFTIVFSDVDMYTLTNTLGQTISTINVKSNNEEFKITNLANGIYFISGNKTTKKIIVNQ